MLIPVGKTFSIVDDDGITGDMLHVVATWRLGLHGQRAVNWKLVEGYAVMQGGCPKATIAMHNLVLEMTGFDLCGLKADHMNGNRLDNRRENLRPATTAQNGANRGPNANNTSGFKGVYWHKQNQKWTARIMVNGRLHRLGYFADSIAAARAYDVAAKELHGAFAHLNFPAAARQA